MDQAGMLPGSCGPEPTDFFGTQRKRSTGVNSQAGHFQPGISLVAAVNVLFADWNIGGITLSRFRVKTDPLAAFLIEHKLVLTSVFVGGVQRERS
jgi:hypothetical protein